MDRRGRAVPAARTRGCETGPGTPSTRGWWIRAPWLGRPANDGRRYRECVTPGTLSAESRKAVPYSPGVKCSPPANPSEQPGEVLLQVLDAGGVDQEVTLQGVTDLGG